MHKFLFYNKFIIFLYMFRALLCSKHVEVNLFLKKKTRILALSWSIANIILRCAVSKTSKFLMKSILIQTEMNDILPTLCFYFSALTSLRSLALLLWHLVANVSHHLGVCKP